MKLSLWAALGLVSLGFVAPASAQQSAFAIGNGGSNLLRFQTNTPGAAVVGPAFNLNGQNTFLDAIDFRPLNGQLYGYQDLTDSLYTVNINTGALSLVASGTGASATNTQQLGIDFNPTVDRVRVVTDSGQNLVYDPNTSNPPTVNVPLFYAPGDVGNNTLGGPLIIDNAYSNNIANAGLPTTQYGIDYGRDTLVIINNNAGTLFTVGNLGVDTDFYTGFDIFTGPTGTNSAYAILGNGLLSSFYSINLGTGAATLIGSFASSLNQQIYSLAVVPTAAVPEPRALLALLTGGALLLGLVVRRRRLA